MEFEQNLESIEEIKPFVTYQAIAESHITSERLLV
jgi:hypothetical protein